MFTVNEAAFILKLHPVTIRRNIKTGKLGALKVGYSRRITAKQLNEFAGTNIAPEKNIANGGESKNA